MSAASSFIHTSRNVSLDGSSLKAECQRENGDWVQSGSLDLNAFIGNDDGEFKWGGSNFNDSAVNVRLSGYPEMLLGDLPDKAGDINIDQWINLGDHIQNKDGQLTYVS